MQRRKNKNKNNNNFFFFLTYIKCNRKCKVSHEWQKCVLKIAVIVSKFMAFEMRNCQKALFIFDISYIYHQQTLFRKPSLKDLKKKEKIGVPELFRGRFLWKKKKKSQKNKKLGDSCWIDKKNVCRVQFGINFMSWRGNLKLGRHLNALYQIVKFSCRNFLLFIFLFI